MDMFTSYGHIEKPKQITDFLMILVWASPFNCNMTHRQINLYRMFIDDFSVNSQQIFMIFFSTAVLMQLLYQCRHCQCSVTTSQGTDVGHGSRETTDNRVLYIMCHVG